MTDVVLVHGSTQTAAGYWRLVDALEHRGHRALTVEVPSAAAATSAEYAELLAAQLPEDLRWPVVAAHSAAGLLLPALAERLDAAHQVWMAAAVTDYAGERSLITEVGVDPTALFHLEWVGIDPTTDPVLATYFLFHDADLAILRRALRTVASCDLSAVYAETPLIDPAARPSTYLLPAGDRTLTRGAMLRFARERLHVVPVEVPGGHSNYVAHDEVVADAIDQACRGVGDAHRFRDLYQAFNARDFAAVLAAMTGDVDWPNAWEGGRVHGREAVRSYWERQWAELDPRVDLVTISTRSDGRVAVEVHQIARNLAGDVLWEGPVLHVYELRDGLVARMDVEESAAAR